MIIEKIKKNNFFIKNKKVVEYFVVFMVTFVLSFCLSYFILPLSGDEIWCYGFSYNMSRGIVIYRDFNCLQMPLYFMLGSIFIKIFGNYLFSIHIMNSLMCGGMVCFLYRKMGYNFLYSLLFLLIILRPTYNFFVVFLAIIVFYLVENKNNNLLISFIIGLIFITKQNIGICLLIPCLYYSKNKLKSLIMFSIPFMLLSIYLLWNGAFYNFIDYCFLGMLDFNDNKYFECVFIIEIIINIILIYKLIKVKFNDKVLFYVLMFQLITYPIFELYHFSLAFMAVFYYFIKNKRCNFLYLTIVIIVYMQFMPINVRISNDKSNFLYMRNINQIDINLLKSQKILISKYKKKYNNVYFISPGSSYSYLLKLYIDFPINKYDLLNTGNLGYDGENKYINEIKDDCTNDSCVFFLTNVYSDANQLPFKIYNYIIKNYKLVREKNKMFIYDNKE